MFFGGEGWSPLSGSWEGGRARRIVRSDPPARVSSAVSNVANVRTPFPSLPVCSGRHPQEKDPAVQAMTEVTEEGKKVARMGGDKYWAVFR